MRAELSLRRFVPPGIRSRGEDYYLSNRVLTVNVEGRTILCKVRGSDVYKVQLSPQKDNLVTSCTCPFFADQGQTCKHIWAAIRESSVRGLLSGTFNSLTHGGTIVPFRPRREHQAEPPPRWRSLLDALPSLSPEGTSPHRSTQLPDEILYILAETTTVAPKWSLNLAVKARSRKRNGEWGPAKRFTPDLRQIESLEAFDREMLLTLNLQTSATPIESDHRLRPASAALLLEKLIREGRLYLERGTATISPIEWDDGAAWELIVEVVHAESGGGYAMRGALVRGDEHLPLDATRLIIPGMLFTGEKAARLADTDALDWVDVLLKAGTVEIPESERDALIARLLHAPTAIRIPEELAAEEVDVALTPVIRLARAHEDAGDIFEAKLAFLYGDSEIDSGEHQRAWLDGRRIIRRDIPAEQAFIRELAGAGFVTSYYRGYSIRAGILGPALDQLVRSGWSVEIDDKQVRATDEMKAEITSGIDWFDLAGGARFGEETVPLPELLTALERRRPLVLLSDGSLGIVPGEWLEKFTAMAQLADRSAGTLRFRNHQALLIDALLGTRTEEAGFARVRDTITSAQRAEPARESETFRGELRPYQREGLGWLLYLREAGIGGCLADDMGLGKTIQVLALLDLLQAEKTAPSIVVAPRSLLFNWKNEAERFTPELRVLEHHGNDRDRDMSRFDQYDLILTTYGTMRLDIAQLAQVEFEYAILDEAQAVKNSSSQIAKAVRLLRSRHRLALSGTPIENHIGELWSLFEFLDPGMLGPARWFQRNFAAKSVSPEKRQLLGEVLRPLILRRTKEQVAPELPSRTEQTLYCELDPWERKQYEELRQYYRATLLETVRSKGLARSKMHVLEALLRLRQAACHPALLGKPVEGSSSKLQLLSDELADVLDSGHRALIFSQFTSLLALVRKELDARKITYAYLDGATRNRGEIVEKFQSSDGPPLFLISLKAGGVGLNLTAADYVFLLDPWWNPAVEAQAIDRTHRIGQAKPVVAYRLIARDTVEEKILDLQAAKRDLAGSIINDENSILRVLNAEDLDRLLS